MKGRSEGDPTTVTKGRIRFTIPFVSVFTVLIVVGLWFTDEKYLRVLVEQAAKIQRVAPLALTVEYVFGRRLETCKIRSDRMVSTFRSKSFEFHHVRSSILQNLQIWVLNLIGSDLKKIGLNQIGPVNIKYFIFAHDSEIKITSSLLIYTVF